MTAKRCLLLRLSKKQTYWRQQIFISNLTSEVTWWRTDSMQKPVSTRPNSILTKTFTTKPWKLTPTKRLASTITLSRVKLPNLHTESLTSHSKTLQVKLQEVRCWRRRECISLWRLSNKQDRKCCRWCRLMVVKVVTEELSPELEVLDCDNKMTSSTDSRKEACINKLQLRTLKQTATTTYPKGKGRQ